VLPGGEATATGGCFGARALLDLSFESTPTPLGTVTAGPDGTFAARLVVPLHAEPGTHHVVAIGLGADGTPHRSDAPVTVVEVDCGDVPAARAQAILDANPSDPHRLDSDHDGTACEDDRTFLPATGGSGLRILLYGSAIAFVVGGQLLVRSASSAEAAVLAGPPRRRRR
jgi:hypothetical protein